MIKVNQSTYDDAQTFMRETGKWRVDPDVGLVRPDGRLAGGLNVWGYIRVRFTWDGRTSTALAHRVIWESIHGAIAEGLYINHIDGVKSNNALANLELVTHSENMEHAHRTGLMDPVYEHGQGDLVRAVYIAAWESDALIKDIAAAHGVSKYWVTAVRRGKLGRRYTESLDVDKSRGAPVLTDAQVSELRCLSVAGKTPTELAFRFGVSRRYVRDLVAGTRRISA